MSATHIRVLIVDDSPTMRRMLRDGLVVDPTFVVVGEAGDAWEARDLIVAHRPDVITLDVEMPRMDGLEFLRRLMPQLPVPVVMVTGATRSGDELALTALSAGAVDIVRKGSGGREDLARVMEELRTKLRIAASANVSGWKRAMLPAHSTAACPWVARPSEHIVAIGASTGGTDATRRVLARMPADGPGIVVAQHMPAGFTAMYADRLNEELDLRVVEAKDGETIMRGTVYIAPGERQCAVLPSNGGFAVCVRAGEKVSGHSPSVDVLFASVARAAGRRAVGALLTGMGRDGADGLLEMRRAGARTLVQDERTAVVYGMPRAAWEQGAAEAQVPIDEMAAAILARVQDRRAALRTTGS